MIAIDTGGWGDSCDTSKPRAAPLRTRTNKRAPRVGSVRERLEARKTENDGENETDGPSILASATGKSKSRRGKKPLTWTEQNMQAERVAAGLPAEEEEPALATDVAGSVVSSEERALMNKLAKLKAKAGISSAPGASASSSGGGASAQADEPAARPVAGKSMRKMNAVTGKFEIVSVASTKGKVRDGAMLIDQKYLRAAAAAGCGSGTGMYSHLTAVRKEVDHEKFEKERSEFHHGSSGASSQSMQRPSERSGGGNRSGGPTVKKVRVSCWDVWWCVVRTRVLHRRHTSPQLPLSHDAHQHHSLRIRSCHSSFPMCASICLRCPLSAGNRALLFGVLPDHPSPSPNDISCIYILICLNRPRPSYPPPASSVYLSSVTHRPWWVGRRSIRSGRVRGLANLPRSDGRGRAGGATWAAAVT